MMADMDINVSDVALIFEGGGMRCSATAGMVVTLIERDINFKNVYGISAGSSHTVNYVSRDIPRAKASFVDLVNDPRFGGWGSFLRGTGYFNAPYLYEGIIEELKGTSEPMAFDEKTFFDNPADVHIEAFDWDSGDTVAWTKEDIRNGHDVGLMVRASSSMPLFMPPTTIAGRTYLDGGMGSSWGILLDAARADGYERFLVVRSQERSYRKKPMPTWEQNLFRLAFRAHPLVAERTIERWRHYNAILDELEVLQSEGAAYVYCPDTMPITNRETDYDRLKACYDAGYAQAQREISAIEAWLR